MVSKKEPEKIAKKKRPSKGLSQVAKNAQKGLWAGIKARFLRFAVLCLVAFLGIVLGAVGLRWLDQKAQVDRAFSEEHLLEVPRLKTETASHKQTALVSADAAKALKSACIKEDGFFYKNLVPSQSSLRKASIAVVLLGTPRVFNTKDLTSGDAARGLALLPRRITVALSLDTHTKKVARALHEKECEVLALMKDNFGEEGNLFLSSDRLHKELKTLFKNIPFAIGVATLGRQKILDNEDMRDIFFESLCDLGSAFLDGSSSPTTIYTASFKEKGGVCCACDVMLDLDTFERLAFENESSSRRKKNPANSKVVELVQKKLLHKKHIVIGILTENASLSHMQNIKRFINALKTPLLPLSKIVLNKN